MLFRSNIMKDLELRFGTIIKWALLVYNVYTKSKELENIEKYMTSIESKRNNTINCIEKKKEILFRNTEKINEIAKNNDKLSHILVLVMIF